jgi:hypothetical protein
MGTPLSAGPSGAAGGRLWQLQAPAREPTAGCRLARPLLGTLPKALLRDPLLNEVEPLAWLTDVLERRTKAHELERLLPWAWKAEISH